MFNNITRYPVVDIDGDVKNITDINIFDQETIKQSDHNGEFDGFCKFSVKVFEDKERVITSSVPKSVAAKWINGKRDIAVLTSVFMNATIDAKKH